MDAGDAGKCSIPTCDKSSRSIPAIYSESSVHHMVLHATTAFVQGSTKKFALNCRIGYPCTNSKYSPARQLVPPCIANMSASASMTIAQHTCCQLPRRPLAQGLRFRIFSAGKHVSVQQKTLRIHTGQLQIVWLTTVPCLNPHFPAIVGCWGVQ